MPKKPSKKPVRKIVNTSPKVRTIVTKNIAPRVQLTVEQIAKELGAVVSDSVSRPSVYGRNKSNSIQVLTPQDVAILRGLPRWEVVHDKSEDYPITAPGVRRIAVPGGWIYQVQTYEVWDTHEDANHNETKGQRFGWSAPIFVKDPSK